LIELKKECFMTVRHISLIAAVLFASIASLGAARGSAAMTSKTHAISQMHSLLGTWTCTMGGEHHTQTFSSIMRGNGMRISEHDSEDLITFDTRRQKWIDEHVGMDGYSVMEGPSVKGGVDVVQVYPAADAKMSVRFPSKNKQVETFSGTMNGKKVSQSATCTR
jgi:hypothetical protein